MIARLVAYVSDLMSASRIEATLEQRGYEVYVVDELQALAAELDAGAKLCLLDLHAGAAAADVVVLCKQRGVPVVAFGRHTEAALLREARKAGCETVLPRSEFFEKMTTLIDETLPDET